MGNAFDLFIAHHFRDLFNHRGFVHLIGDFLNDDRIAIFANFLDFGLGADHDGSTALKIGFARPRAPQDHAAGREIRAGYNLHQTFGGYIRIVDQFQRRIDNFAQVMRRNIGRHTHSNTARAIDEHIGKAGREHGRLRVFAIIIEFKINRVFVDIREQISGRFVHAHFGIAHRRRGIAIHRAKVTLTIQKRQGHGKRLGHTDQRIIDRAVTMGVEFTHCVTHRAGRFQIGFVMGVAHLMHGVKNAPMHGFETVTQVRNRPAHDHAHRVIEIGAFHLI